MYEYDRIFEGGGQKLDFLERNSEERDIEVENGGLDNALAMLRHAYRGDSMGRMEAGRQGCWGRGLPPQRQIYIRPSDAQTRSPHKCQDLRPHTRFMRQAGNRIWEGSCQPQEVWKKCVGRPVGPSRSGE